MMFGFERWLCSNRARRLRSCSGTASVALLLFVGAPAQCLSDVDPRGGQFIGFTRFSPFNRAAGSRPGEVVLTSRVINTRIDWDELVVSWNATAPDGTYLKVEARGFRFRQPTPYYNLGLWSPNPARHPRESVLNQADETGDVATDTLVLKERCQQVQIRLTLGGDDALKPELKFLGLCLTDTTANPPSLSPNRGAWGKVLPVPERSQMVYPNGNVICSPTTISMMMGFWAQRLHRPELDLEVPEIVKAVYDTNWKGTGNWVFNTAYAGSCQGMRAYVTRMTDLSELEDWIAGGFPVGLSLCYDRLRGRPGGPSGHLVVCVGFTPEGDPIVNDPGTRENVQKVFKRKNLEYAWAYSRNAAYLIYPENAAVPSDRFGHWHSWTSTRRIRFD